MWPSPEPSVVCFPHVVKKDWVSMCLPSCTGIVYDFIVMTLIVVGKFDVFSWSLRGEVIGMCGGLSEHLAIKAATLDAIFYVTIEFCPEMPKARTATLPTKFPPNPSFLNLLSLQSACCNYHVWSNTLSFDCFLPLKETFLMVLVLFLPGRVCTAM